jgi:predicted MFS family arabinose efflux permease
MCLVLSDIVLASASKYWTFFLGITLWGIQYGTTMNIFLSLINEVVPENLRGTGLGVYFITCATATMLGDTCMGHIAQHFETTRAAFVASGIISVIGLMSLIVIMGYKIKQK